MKKLFFIAVLLGTIVLTSVFAFSYWRLQTRTPEAYFELGKAQYEKGKLSEATIQFLKALQRDANHRDSRYYLALTYFAQQDLASGVQQLRALLGVYPDDVQANLKLGNLYLSSGGAGTQYYQLAQESARTVLNKDPQNVSALILLGNASAGLQDYTTSLQALEKACTLEPGSVSPWISLGSAQARQKNFSAAEKSFLKAREVDPTDKSAFVSLANYYRLVGAPEKAEAIFGSALAAYPADREIYSQATDFYLTTRRFGDVERMLKAAQAASPNDPTPTIDLAEVYQVQNRNADARNLLLDAKSKLPTSIPLAIKLATNLMADKRDQAKQEIDQVLKEDPNNAAARELLAEYQFHSGQFDAAEKTLSGQSASLNPRVPYLLGNLALARGKTADAQTYFQKSIQLDRRFLPARAAILNGLVLQNRLDEARNEVREILAIDPRNLPTRMIKTSLDMAEKNYPAAGAGLTELVQEFPENYAIHRQLGVYYASRGRNAEAEKSFLRALELSSNRELSFQDLIQFYLQTHQTDRAMQKLASVPDAEKEAFHYELAGITAEQAGKLQDSELNYKRAIEKDPKRLSAQVSLLKQYLRTGRKEEALKRLDELAQKSSTSSAVYALRGIVQQNLDDLKGAEESYRKALEIDPASDLAANNLAYLLSHEGRDLETALQMAQEVRRRQPENPDIADTLGWVYYKLNNFSLAASQAEFAVSKQPGNGEYQYHLGQIYRKNSENAKAVAAFRKAVNSAKDFTEKKQAVAALEEVQRETAGSKR